MVSEQSRSDYTLHAIEDGSGDPCVVIIEAKYEMSIAQAIGYFLATSTSIEPPLVLIMDNRVVRILLFPFRLDGKPLVNCLALPRMGIFINSDEGDSALNRGLFELILRFSARKFNVELDCRNITDFQPIEVRNLRPISTVTEQFHFYKKLYKESSRQIETIKEAKKQQLKELKQLKEKNKQQLKELKEKNKRLAELETLKQEKTDESSRKRARH